MAKSTVWEHNVTCTYNHTQYCNRPYEESCHVGVYCSKDPNKHKQREVTYGQSKFLMERGFSEEEVNKMSFNEAGDKIREIKQTSLKGIEKVWY